DSARRAANDDRRRAEAARRAAQLEAKMATLVIDVGHRVDGMVVRRDGVLVDTAAWNVPVPIDPGRYVVSVEAPGFAPWRTEVAIDTATKKRTLVVPPLARAPVTETNGHTSSPIAELSAGTPPRATASESPP